MASKRKLPKKLSDGIHHAIDDLIAVERMKSKYVINMSTWHNPVDDELPCADAGKCQVCLAGSVIANTLKVNPTKHVDPYDMNDETLADKLLALDQVRVGDITYAVTLWYSVDEISDVLKSDVITLKDTMVDEYAADPAKFKKTMRKIANDLAAVGL